MLVPARRRRARRRSVVLTGAGTSSRRLPLARPDRRRLDAAHFDVYDFVPQILHLHPLFGLGLNNFSVYYEFVTGKTNWGPHSFYVALLVETGLVGTALFAVFLWYLFRAAAALARALGRALAAARRPARRARPAARVGADRGARRDDGRERLLPDDVVLLLLRLRELALAAPLVFGAARER